MAVGKKGFQKGNKLGGRRKEGEHIKAYLEELASGTAREYYTNVDRLMSGEDLPKPTKEGMDRFEKNLEYIAPKLARTEVKAEVTQKNVIVD